MTEAASGIEFYRALKLGRYDIAVLDVNLPDANGFDLAADIAGGHDMGVIILTARTGRDDRVRGYGEGADIYLTKPVDSEELALAIGNLARRTRHSVAAAPPRRDTSVSAEKDLPWQLDRRRKTLDVPGVASVKLSARETVLLE
ncbi:response regulator transcription factor, partial [Rhizobiaceae sp. 2RAB30]